MELHLELTTQVHKPSKSNVFEGFVVAIDGYQVGLSVISLAAGLSSSQTYPHLNPVSAYFYTNIYRWALRHISLLPFWVGGHGGHYCDTHKVWRRRFYYVDEFMPKWLRHLFPYVDDKEWKQEETEFKRFKKYSEPAFGRHYRYPTKSFNDFKSFETQETLENSDIQSSSSSNVELMD
ncbi:uncharacterized protein [Epargyreus clarus]|uniref:uncharacterized protein isoform X2 n=1 Tax=Epargyreus clarus TaxID=520877 RepID=UPI003C2D99A4